MGALSGIPGLLTTSSAFNIKSGVCFPSSKGISYRSSCSLYLSWITDISETNTSNPFTWASTAAPTPLSPAPNTTILFFFSILEPFLSHFQRHYRNGCKHDANNPEANDDLRLRHSLQRFLYQSVDSCITRFLKMMVQRRHLENPTTLSVFSFRNLEISDLYHYRQIFHEENRTQNRNQQLLMYTKSEHGNNTAQREATRIAHKHLSRERIIPQKTDCRPHKSAGENDQFLAPRYIHDIQIRCVRYMPRQIGQYAQCQTHDGRSSRR